MRTEASRLRARLSEYYLGVGKDDALVIDLPKGGYVPVFRQVVAVPDSSLPGRREPQGQRFLPRRVWITAAIAGAIAISSRGVVVAPASE